VRRLSGALADNRLLLAIDIDQCGRDTCCRSGRPDLDFTREGALNFTGGSAAYTSYQRWLIKEFKQDMTAAFRQHWTEARCRRKRRY
jgi:hypothetical protein